MAAATTTYSPLKTRQQLLAAAFEEIWQGGFRAASIDRMLDKAGVTKGALYHHFKNKLDLGYAVLDEVVRTMSLDSWVKPLHQAIDPIATIWMPFDLAVAFGQGHLKRRNRKGIRASIQIGQAYKPV